MKFQICSKEVRKFDGNQTVYVINYWIQIQHKFLWWTYWKNYKEYSYSSFDSKSTKYFDTLEAAESFVHLIVKNEQYEKRKKLGPSIVKVIEFSEV